MEDKWGVKPPGNWESIDVDSIAKRFNVLPFTVRRKMKEIEVARRKELEAKLALRFNRVSDFLHAVYDMEARIAKCSACGLTGFDTWDELQAHVRCHLLLDNLKDPKFAGVAGRVAADTDKILHPQDKLSLRQKRRGILPADESPAEIEERIAGRIGDGS